MDTAADTEISTWWRIEETNSWEGETWFHYFLDGPDVFESLTFAVHSKAGAEAELELPDRVELSWPQVEALANLEAGYMDLHWFGELTDPEELAMATDLYKGKIRDYGEDLLERIAIE